MGAIPSPIETRSVRAVFLRELRSAVLNRYLQSFGILALAGGAGAALASESAEAPIFFLLQVTIYFVSLFALLVGTSSARAENEEWPLLFAQPVPRFAFILAKFTALWAIFATVLMLLFIPAAAGGGSIVSLARLYLHAVILSAVFGSLGLWAGVTGADRVQALVIAVTVWLFLLFGLDLLSLAAAQSTIVQRATDVWLAGLMLNPLDAFRIQALFALEQIPAETADKTPLAAWWLRHAGAWFVCISVLWSAVLLTVSGRRLANLEV